MEESAPASNRVSTRPLTTWLLGITLFVLLRLIGDSVPLTDATGWLWITRFGEAWIVIGVLALGLSGTPRIASIEAMGRMRTSALALLVLGMLVGHFVFLDGVYPFVNWPMYTAAVEEVSYGDFRLERTNGQSQRLSFHDDLVLSREPRAVKDRLWLLGREAAEGDRAAGDLLHSALEMIVSETDLDVSAVILSTCTVSDPNRTSPATCEEVIRISLGGS